MPERVVRLMMEQRAPPPPPAVPEPKPQEPQAGREDRSPRPSRRRGPGARTGEAPAKAPGKGILAFREKLAGLADEPGSSPSSARRRASTTRATASGARAALDADDPGAGLERRHQPRARSAAASAAARRRRGGIAGVAGRARDEHDRAVGDGAGGRAGRSAATVRGPARTDEEIQIVFDRYKAALYRLYNRELRSDPTLQGQMVLRLTIEPDGSVSLCELHGVGHERAASSSAQVVERVKTLRLRRQGRIPAITILYPIDFLPAA